MTTPTPKLPPASDTQFTSIAWQRFFHDMFKRVAAAGAIAWTLVDKTGSNLTDLTIRNHNDLQSLNAAHAHSSSAIDFLQAGTGAVTQTLQDKNRQCFDAKDYGLSVSNTAAQNLAILKTAVAAVPAGARLIISEGGGIYPVDTTGGLSAAVVIDKPMVLQIDGRLQANYGTMQANPPYLFKVTGSNVAFVGGGTLIGDGSIDDTNAGTDDTIPGLLYVSGNNFSFIGPTIDTPPKTGILLYNCTGAVIANSFFRGGPTTYTTGHTAYFAIRAYQGGKHRIIGNHFYHSVADGMFVSCIFGNGANNMVIANNTCDQPYEKLNYLYGSYNVIANNVVVGKAGNIAGQTIAGTITTVYRVVGHHNKITGNLAYYCAGGATAMDGVCNSITDNLFIACGATGIAAFNSSATAMDQTVIENNLCSAASLTGHTISDGILLYSDAIDSADAIIRNNLVDGFSSTSSFGGIRFIALAPYSFSRALVSGNKVIGGNKGIVTDHIISCVLSDNYVYNTSVAGYTEGASNGDNRWLNNRGQSAQIGITGLRATSCAEGNQYTDASLVGTATLGVAVATTVTHGGVAANARILIQELNAAAGVMSAVKGRCYTTLNGNNFDINVANGTNAAGTEQFAWSIIQ